MFRQWIILVVVVTVYTKQRLGPDIKYWDEVGAKDFRPPCMEYFASCWQNSVSYEVSQTIYECLNFHKLPAQGPRLRLSG